MQEVNDIFASRCEALNDVFRRASKDLQQGFCNFQLAAKYLGEAVMMLQSHYKQVFPEPPHNGIANSKHKPRQVRMRGK